MDEHFGTYFLDGKGGPTTFRERVSTERTFAGNAAQRPENASISS
jgi:hypothetical protein